jgi:hypothetical protein
MGEDVKNTIFVVVGLLAILTTCALAKSPTTKITIKGNSLTTSIEIVDPAILKDFEVWSGLGTGANGVDATEGFIIDSSAGRLKEPPVGGERYDVSFFSEHATLIYEVSYVFNSTTREGFVYLPRTSLNMRTIDRGVEGNWFRATAAWQRTVQPLIMKASVGRGSP